MAGFDIKMCNPKYLKLAICWSTAYRAGMTNFCYNCSLVSAIQGILAVLVGYMAILNTGDDIVLSR